MLNPLHLRTLTTVLEAGSFAVAARRLGYTPSAVSQQIAALERVVRLPLFEREARSIRPTRHHESGGAAVLAWPEAGAQGRMPVEQRLCRHPKPLLVHYARQAHHRLHRVRIGIGGARGVVRRRNRAQVEQSLLQR